MVWRLAYKKMNREAEGSYERQKKAGKLESRGEGELGEGGFVSKPSRNFALVCYNSQENKIHRAKELKMY